MTCRRCGTLIPDGWKPVVLGRRHAFCTKKCRDEWCPDRVLMLEETLNAIRCRTRGKASKIANTALVGNVPPWPDGGG